MSDNKFKHIPVLLKEVIDLLNVRDGKTYVDCTLGGGGHAEALLQKSQFQNLKSKIIGIDTDHQALEAAKERLSQYQNLEFVHDNFRNLKKILTQKVDGILLDLGVSSYQIDEASRGFSLQKDGPLDMRMDQSLKLTAETIVNEYSKDALEKIFKEFGEERFFRRIAGAILAKRSKNKIKSTFELKEVIEKAIPTWKKRESITRIFQALRIAVNEELTSLKIALEDAVDLLNPGGRIVVISYHSLEDRLAKYAFREAKEAGHLKIITKKPLRPSAEEIASNPRAGSAKLRAGEKI
jgi:16S rRNA (cytosine1402-N4)-methyltransferase